MSPRRGLLVSILRDASGGDFTANGVTSPARATRGMAILLGVPDGNWVEGNLPEDLPVLVAEKRSYRGEEYWVAKPAGLTGHSMMGGNFGCTSDGRYRAALCAYPMPVHDRVEG